MLGALGVIVLVLIGAMVVTVIAKAWPSFRYNGLSWFGSGGEVDAELRSDARKRAPARPRPAVLPRLAA